MIQVFIYLFSGSLYIFDKPFNHPYQQPEKAIGDTVWVNTAPKTGFWAVVKPNLQ
jgi:hypothetical protein